MIEFFIRIFANKKTNTAKEIDRNVYISVGTLVGACLNLLLFAVKLAVGLLTGSIAVISDSINNLSDTGVSIISFIGLRWAAKPADRDHPYGHGRMEYILGLVISFFILLVGVDFFRSSIDRIMNPVPVTGSTLANILIFISILVKVYLFIFYKDIGKKTNSTSFKSASADCISDVAVTSSALFSLLLSPHTDIPVDGIVGLIVSLLVLYAGFKVAKDSLQPILGDPPSTDMVEALAAILHEESEILGVHDVLIHDYGPKRSMASAHVEVNSARKITYIHDIIDRLEKEVMHELNIPLTIHVDPVASLDEDGSRIKKEIREAAQKISRDFTIHDFKLVKSKNKISVFFELDVPPNFQMEDEEIKNKMVCAADHKIQFFIRIERSYF